METKRRKIRELGSKYFGRAIREHRFAARLSQEDLAERADVSVATLGALERERGTLSMTTLCKLCIGLESQTGSPMLKPVFDTAVLSLWHDLRSMEGVIRAERGWAAPDSLVQEELVEEEFKRYLDSLVEGMKGLSRLKFRLSLGAVRSPVSLPRADPLPEPGRRRIRAARRKG